MPAALPEVPLTLRWMLQHGATGCQLVTDCSASMGGCDRAAAGCRCLVRRKHSPDVSRRAARGAPPSGDQQRRRRAFAMCQLSRTAWPSQTSVAPNEIRYKCSSQTPRRTHGSITDPFLIARPNRPCCSVRQRTCRPAFLDVAATMSTGTLPSPYPRSFHSRPYRRTGPVGAT